MKSFDEQKILNCGQAIDDLVNIDFHARGVLKSIYQAFLEKVGEPLSTYAAKGLLEVLKEPGKIVLIGTGFMIKPTLKPETDGPIASALLARAVSLLGGKPVIVIEKEGVKATVAACNAAELNVCESIEEALNTPHSVAVEAMPACKEEKEAKGKMDYFLSYHPAAMVSIEHPGSGDDRKYYSVMGYALDDWVAPIDRLLEEVRAQGGFTIGVGDAGNEAGMGHSKEAVEEYLPYGELTSAKSSCDAPIIASVSDFAVLGLIAAMQVITGKKVLPGLELEEVVVRSTVIAGSLDGCTDRQIPAIDMIDINYIKSFLHMLDAIVYYTEEFAPTRPFFVDYLRGADIGAPGTYSGGHGGK